MYLDVRSAAALPERQKYWKNQTMCMGNTSRTGMRPVLRTGRRHECAVCAKHRRRWQIPEARQGISTEHTSRTGMRPALQTGRRHECAVYAKHRRRWQIPEARQGISTEHTRPDGNATCLADGTKTRVCSVCKVRETVRDPGSRLVPTGSLSQKKIRLQYRQSTSAVKVSGLAKGDFVQKWKSSRPSVASVSSKGRLPRKKRADQLKFPHIWRAAKY